MNFGEVLTTILGVLMGIGHFPQAYKIYKNKSAVSTSLITYIIFAIGSLVWVIYGLRVHDNVIVYSFLPGVVGSWLVLGLTLRYRKADTSKEH